MSGNDNALYLLLTGIIGMSVVLAVVLFLGVRNEDSDVAHFKQDQTENVTTLEPFDRYVLEPTRYFPFETESVMLRYDHNENDTFVFTTNEREYSVKRNIGTTFRVDDSTLRIVGFNADTVSLRRVK